MTVAVDKNTSWPTLTLQRIDTSDEIKDYYPATVSVEFQGAEIRSEAKLLTKILEALPILLTALDESTIEERLRHLCRAIQLEDSRPSINSEVFQNGEVSIESFFRTVPLLSEEDVRDRFSSNKAFALSDLMQVSYGGMSYYIADQFTPDGSIHDECIDCWRILKSKSSDEQWERAMWWICPSGWFEGGNAPRDIFKEDPEGVRRAAEQWANRDEH